jgi:hypothetical protein
MTLVVPSVYEWRHPGPGTTQLAALFTCSQCNAPSIGTHWSNSSRPAIHVMNDITLDPEWLPASASGKEYPEAPSAIASTADEAHRCFSINAYRGAIALARAALEATAKDKEYTKGNLDKKIKDMVEGGLLRPNIGVIADQLRLAGNGVLHADNAGDDAKVDAPDSTDAENALWLLDQVLAEVYQSTARLASIQERADAAKAKKQDPEPV